MSRESSGALFRVERTGVPGRNVREGRIVERFQVSEPGSSVEEVAVAVTLADGGSWIGVFESGGYESPPAVGFELFEWPDGKSFCVVVGGAGRVVRADLTGDRRIGCLPITGIAEAPDLGLVVFTDFTTAVAFDATRCAWESPRLAYDELEIVEVHGAGLRLRGRNAPERRTDELTLDLRTGVPRDGFYPADRPWLGDLNLKRRR